MRDGRIESLREYDDLAPGVPLIDAGDAALLPGLVDTHVHVNEPGRTEWEGFASATAAAAAGGVTTLVDMPLNSIPATTTGEALRAKQEAARGRCRVDVGFWGGVVPGNAHELPRLAEAGALGFKCFLVPSGVDEFDHVGEYDLREALPILARLGLPLLAHAELPEAIGAAAGAAGDPHRYETWLASRPAAAEESAIALLIELCRLTDAHVHIVHLSAATALPMLREARAEGLRLTVETCPHYLWFAAEDVQDGATELKCAPPIRERDNRDALWRALRSGGIDMIVSDHSPCPPELKSGERGDFMEAWGGIASLQLGLSVVWAAASRRGHDLGDVARWMSSAPARLAGLSARKGSLEPGRDADIVVFDPDVEWDVDAARLLHRHRVTPYAGARLRGIARATYLRGEHIQQDGAMVGEPLGVRLERSEGRWTSRI